MWSLTVLLDRRAPLRSLQNVPGAGEENAGAARLAPDALIDGARRAVAVVARPQLALVDPEFTVEKMQLFGTRVGVRRVMRARRQAHQHADPMPGAVGRQQLAFDAGRDLLPIGLRPSLRRGLAGLPTDPPRETRLQR